MKILGLHGFTQTGPLFQRKTLRLQEHLQRAFPGVSFYFPTGPIALKVSDRLDYLESIQKEERTDGFKNPDDIDAHGWFRLYDNQATPSGLVTGLDQIADILQNEGPFDGIISFSQGAIVACMVTSLLEGPIRRRAFERYETIYSDAFPYPESYRTLNHPPLKFGITYGAYTAVSPRYAAFYTDPLIETPFMHFVGEYDTVVPTEMTVAMEKAQIGGSRSHRIVHPGGHAIPVGTEYHNAVVNFIQRVYYTSSPSPWESCVFSLDPLRFANEDIETGGVLPGAARIEPIHNLNELPVNEFMFERTPSLTSSLSSSTLESSSYLERSISKHRRRTKRGPLVGTQLSTRKKRTSKFSFDYFNLHWQLAHSS